MDRDSLRNLPQSAHKHIVENFLDCYLVKRDAEKTINFVTDDIYSLGTGVQEVAHNKGEFKALIYSEMGQLSSPITYKLGNYEEKLVSEEAFVCICDVTTTIEVENQQPIHYATRLTAGFRKIDGVFLAYHLHMSEPSAVQQEYEFFPLHYETSESRKIDTDKQLELVELMKKMLPGGAMGGYVEPGFPLYFVNDELLDWLGYTYEEFVADTGAMMINTIYPEDANRVEQEISEAFATGNEYAVEYRMKKKDRSYIWVRDIGRKTIAPNGRNAIISIIADISSERLRQQSFEKTIASMKKERRRIDRMTGMLNREPAQILIEQHLVREQTGAFFLMDMDNFKLVNDMKGHPAGDRVLHTVARKLKSIFPETAILARLGGDEFVAFLPEYENVEQLETYARRIVAGGTNLIEDPVLAHRLGVSVGIAFAPDHGTEINTLYSNADKGLYYAKRNGKNGYSFYEHSVDSSRAEVKNPNLHTLRRMIQGVLVDQGAFRVEYDTFNKICEFALRNFHRLQHATQIVLFSLQIEGMTAEEMDLEDVRIQESKKLLEDAIQYGLRIGDLMMDFSPNQIAVLLVNCDEENAERVAKRVSATYEKASMAHKAAVVYEWGGIQEE